MGAGGQGEAEAWRCGMGALVKDYSGPVHYTEAPDWYAARDADGYELSKGGPDYDARVAAFAAKFGMDDEEARAFLDGIGAEEAPHA